MAVTLNPSSWFGSMNDWFNSTSPNATNNGGAGIMLDAGNNIINSADSGFDPLVDNTKVGNNRGPGTSLGMNVGTLQAGLAGLGALGGVFSSLEANKLAKEQFKFSKGLANTNLTNQIQSYNTALSDRITSRAATQGMSDAEVQDYLSKNRLTR